jgi:hypothetical protein
MKYAEIVMLKWFWLMKDLQGIFYIKLEKDEQSESNCHSLRVFMFGGYSAVLHF